MKALITGVTGQDGSYLAELLLDKGYEVYGLIRRTSEVLTAKIQHLESHARFKCVAGDMTDGASVNRWIKSIRPNEIYNLAGMSQVRWSYDIPVNTFDVNTLGLLRVIEAVRANDLDARIYQACSSEMFGKVLEEPQTETTPFYPQSPYGVSKAASYYMARTYREAYGMKIYCGILFNHESPRRGSEFLSRKVCSQVAEIYRKTREFIELGNMEAKRDWGYAKEYAEWIWRIVQHETPEDFVICTGEQHSVREWVELAFNYVHMPLRWEGEGVNEIGYFEDRPVVKINPDFYRPAEVNTLLGSCEKSRRVLGFEPQVKFTELVSIMMEAELHDAA